MNHITYRVQYDNNENQFSIISIDWLSKKYLGLPTLIEITRIGESKIKNGVDCQFILQDGERIWSDGYIERVHDCYHDMMVKEELKDHDLCYYCGADNGRYSEWRIGYDCYYCQSN